MNGHFLIPTLRPLSESRWNICREKSNFVLYASSILPRRSCNTWRCPKSTIRPSSFSANLDLNSLNRKIGRFRILKWKKFYPCMFRPSSSNASLRKELSSVNLNFLSYYHIFHQFQAMTIGRKPEWHWVSHNPKSWDYTSLSMGRQFDQIYYLISHILSHSFFTSSFCIADVLLAFWCIKSIDMSSKLYLTETDDGRKFSNELSISSRYISIIVFTPEQGHCSDLTSSRHITPHLSSRCLSGFAQRQN